MLAQLGNGAIDVAGHDQRDRRRVRCRIGILQSARREEHRHRVPLTYCASTFQLLDSRHCCSRSGFDVEAVTGRKLLLPPEHVRVPDGDHFSTRAP